MASCYISYKQRRHVQSKFREHAYGEIKSIILAVVHWSPKRGGLNPGFLRFHVLLRPAKLIPIFHCLFIYSK